MNCEQVDKINVDLLYGELDELNAAACLRHLNHCERCSLIFSELKNTKAHLEEILPPAPPLLLEQIIELEQSARSNLPLAERIGRLISILAEYAMRPQAAMTAVLLIMIALSFLFVRNTQETQRLQPSLTRESNSQITEEKRLKQRQPKVYKNQDLSDSNKQQAQEMEPSSQEGNNLKASVRIPSYREAMSAFQAGRYATAEQLFHLVSLAGVEKSASAALQEAHSARNGSGCARAAPLYVRVYQSYPNNSLELEARWHSASCFRALGKNDLAVKQLEILAKNAAYQARASKALQALSNDK